MGRNIPTAQCCYLYLIPDGIQVQIECGKGIHTVNGINCAVRHRMWVELWLKLRCPVPDGTELLSFKDIQQAINRTGIKILQLAGL